MTFAISLVLVAVSIVLIAVGARKSKDALGGLGLVIFVVSVALIFMSLAAGSSSVTATADPTYVSENTISTETRELLPDAQGNYGYATTDGLTVFQNINGIPNTVTFPTYQLADLPDNGKPSVTTRTAYNPTLHRVWVWWPSHTLVHTTIILDTDKVVVR